MMLIGLMTVVIAQGIGALLLAALVMDTNANLKNIK